jgi:hypothetical protein
MIVQRYKDFVKMTGENKKSFQRGAFISEKATKTKRSKDIFASFCLLRFVHPRTGTADYFP